MIHNTFHTIQKRKSGSTYSRMLMLAIGIVCLSVMTISNLIPSVYTIRDMATSILYH